MDAYYEDIVHLINHVFTFCFFFVLFCFPKSLRAFKSSGIITVTITIVSSSKGGEGKMIYFFLK